MRRSDDESANLSRRAWIRAAVAASAGLGLSGAVLRGPLVGRRQAAEPGPVVIEGCVGCTSCVAVCPVDVIEVQPGGILIDGARCIRCGYCAALCPLAALQIKPGARR